MKFSQIKKIIPKHQVVSNGRDFEITSVCYDSRQATPGALFVTIKGEATDGHSFIPEAIKRGVAAIITQKKTDTDTNIPQIVVPDTRLALAVISHEFYNQPSSKLKVIGITGTNGKTTTACLIRSVLEAAGNKVGQLGTISYSIGSREIPAPITTPESCDIAYYLSEMFSAGLNYAVMEASSHSLVQKRVYGIKFVAGVFTNLGRDHLDYHKNTDEYLKAKAILFRELPEESTALLNADDPSSNYLESITKARVLKYGLTQKSGFSAQIKSNSLSGLSLIINSPVGEFTVESPLIGQHNAYNILSAVATVYSLGITNADTIAKGIARLKSVRGRLESVRTDKPFSVMVDFAHTPDALEQTLSSLKPLVKGKLIVLFGCGGDRDKGKRPLMAKAVEQYADMMVLTSDNPRSEDPMAIIEDIKKGLTTQNYIVEADRRRAIEKALDSAKEGDLVLIAGKGHETYQIFKNTIKPFDDKAVVEEILGLNPKKASSGLMVFL
ncbi:MAG: UDP-N-acetylmuramoyl-L-alanyl-D-glutamate--2,6-diaminopimelate ligase [Planctomycetes bacterium]|nr:UDP-N-acetylmuramoyl-L-alanyl-D-glutamate--2,6-diaminopimelate ligase [Planctomycetota bacterium]